MVTSITENIATADFEFRSHSIKRGEKVFIVHQHFPTTNSGVGYSTNAIANNKQQWIGDTGYHDHQETLGKYISETKTLETFEFKD